MQREREASEEYSYLHMRITYSLNAFFLFFNELCWGNAMVAYTKPQQWKKEASKMLRGERDPIQFIDLGFER